MDTPAPAPAPLLRTDFETELAHVVDPPQARLRPLQPYQPMTLEDLRDLIARAGQGDMMDIDDQIT